MNIYGPLIIFLNLYLFTEIETQRYFRPKIPYERCFCVVCQHDDFENEEHYLFLCTAYNDLSQLWLSCLDKPGKFRN